MILNDVSSVWPLHHFRNPMVKSFLVMNLMTVNLRLMSKMKVCMDGS